VKQKRDAAIVCPLHNEDDRGVTGGVLMAIIGVIRKSMAK
jgi:hypothetical protein